MIDARVGCATKVQQQQQSSGSSANLAGCSLDSKPSAGSRPDSNWMQNTHTASQCSVAIGRMAPEFGLEPVHSQPELTLEASSAACYGHHCVMAKINHGQIIGCSYRALVCMYNRRAHEASTLLCNLLPHNRAGSQARKHNGLAR